MASQPQSWPANHSKQASQPTKQPPGLSAVGGCHQVVEKPPAIDQASPPAGQPWPGGWTVPGWLHGRLDKGPCWPDGQLAGCVPGCLAGRPRNLIRKMDQEIGTYTSRSHFPKHTNFQSNVLIRVLGAFRRRGNLKKNKCIGKMIKTWIIIFGA